jgi:hypothetical protein
MSDIQNILTRRWFAVAVAATVVLAPGIAAATPARDKAGIEALVVEVAERNGINPKAFLRMAQIESGLNPNAFHPKSRAAGLFQFIPSTARRYGLRDPFNTRANAEATAALWRDNEKGLANALGRVPSAGELYLAHQQGLGGAIRLLSQPERLATTIVGTKAVTMNGDPARQRGARARPSAPRRDDEFVFLCSAGERLFID